MFTKNYVWKNMLDYELGFCKNETYPIKHAYEGTVYSGGTSLSAFIKVNIISTFMTVLSTGHSTSSISGVAFGDGTVPPTVEDVKLSGTQHTWINSSNTTCEFSYGKDTDGLFVTAIYTINNVSGADATISEVGFFGCTSFKSSSSSSLRYIPVLLERTLLDAPVTIPAGGVGKVTYTIRRSYPSA